jgi:hypothetical protein
MKTIFPVLFWITVFSIAMAFLETAVVIYLRELLYPEGFKFPLAPLPGQLALTEIIREAATIVMLIGAGYMAGKTFSQKFAWFIYSFAIWDIFYYIFLKIMISWPESFMTWDILFLIPVTWTGPVISPVIVSLTMIFLASIILKFASKGFDTKILAEEWGLFITGSIILLVAFTWDYSGYILKYYSIRDLWTIPDKHAIYQTALMYIPGRFNWLMFTVGEMVIIFTAIIYLRRIKKVHL